MPYPPYATATLLRFGMSLVLKNSGTANAHPASIAARGDRLRLSFKRTSVLLWNTTKTTTTVPEFPVDTPASWFS